MKLNTENPERGVFEAACAVDEVAWGMDDPLLVDRESEVTIPAAVLLDLRWAINYCHNRREAERLGVPGPDVVYHPEDHPDELPCFCQECLAPD